MVLDQAVRRAWGDDQRGAGAIRVDVPLDHGASKAQLGGGLEGAAPDPAALGHAVDATLDAAALGIDLVFDDGAVPQLDGLEVAQGVVCVRGGGAALRLGLQLAGGRPGEGRAALGDDAVPGVVRGVDVAVVVQGGDAVAVRVEVVRLDQEAVFVDGP